MQLLAAATVRQAILLPALFLLMAVGAALLACGPAAQPTPENTGIPPAVSDTPTPTPTPTATPMPDLAPKPTHTPALSPTPALPPTPANTPTTPPPTPADTPFPTPTPARHYPELSPTLEKPVAEPTPSPGGDSQTATETYAAIRIWTCADPYDFSTQAVLDWLSDQGISGQHVGIVTGENFLVVDRVAVSLLDTLSQQSDVFGVDHIQESPPPTQYQDGDELWPPPPPLPVRKYPKLDRDLDSLVIAFTKCPGAAWPAAADPQVWVKILLRDNPDTATTRAIVSWLKANGIPIQDSDLYRTWVEGYRDGTTILIYSFPVSLVLPLSEQPSVIGISKHVPETPSVGPAN